MVIPGKSQTRFLTGTIEGDTSCENGTSKHVPIKKNRILPGTGANR